MIRVTYHSAGTTRGADPTEVNHYEFSDGKRGIECWGSLDIAGNDSVVEEDSTNPYVVAVNRYHHVEWIAQRAEELGWVRHGAGTLPGFYAGRAGATHYYANERAYEREVDMHWCAMMAVS